MAASFPFIFKFPSPSQCRNKKSLIFVIFMISVLIIVNITTPEREPQTCWATNNHCSNATELLHLRDIDIETNSIFFFESHGHTYVNPRILCGVESAAILHPNKVVYLLSTLHWVYLTPALRAILTRKNIIIGHLNITRLFDKAPLHKWYYEQRWENSWWPMYELSDALRWAMLWKYGGTYVDNDVVFLRALPNSRLAGWESENWIGAGVLQFKADDPLINDINDIIINDKSSHIWGWMGPRVLTEVIKNRCPTNFSGENSDCDGFHVFPLKAFYYIHYRQWEKFFQDDEHEDASRKILEDENILVIHVWNKFSKGKPINLTLNSIYASVARKFCPIVVESVGTIM